MNGRKGSPSQKMPMKCLFSSSCLIGKRCLYHGRPATFALSAIKYLEGLGYFFVDACPEMLGGLPCPRPASYIREGRVLQLRKDVTQAFEIGAYRALTIAAAAKPAVALLLLNSPSCDPGFGVFGKKLAGLIPTITCHRDNDWRERLFQFLNLPYQRNLFQ